MNESLIWPNGTNGFHIKLLDPKCKPYVGSEFSAGLDLRATWGGRTDFQILEPGSKTLVNTGIQCAIPVGWVGLVMPRSGMGSKFEITLANTVGVIDSDYRGEILVYVTNKGKEAFTLEKYMRFCQMVVVPHWDPNNIFFTDQLPDSIRGGSGFGDSGNT